MSNPIDSIRLDSDINFALVGGRSIAISVSVCLSVCLFVGLSIVLFAISKIARPNFTKHSIRITCGYGSVLL